MRRSPAHAPKLRRQSDGRRSLACCRRSSCKSLDFGSKRGNLARSPAAAVDLANQPAAAGRVGETDELADRRRQRRRIVVGEEFNCVASNDGARGAPVQDESRDQLRSKDPRFREELQHLAGRPAVERRRVGWDEDQVRCEQRGPHQSGNARGPVNDQVTCVSRELGRLLVKRIPCKANDAEEPRQSFPGALLGPVEGRPLWVASRVRALLAELVLDPADGGTLPDAEEIAATAWRALQLPEIVALRGRLVAEWPIYALLGDRPSPSALAGRIDAIAYDGDRAEVVVDWKSDVDPDEREMRFHAGQLEDYRRATGAARGLLVYMTPGVVRWVGALVGPGQAGG
jgi:hypothetical protein